MLNSSNAPLFPQFRKFTIKDRTWYNEIYINYSPSADLSFENLLLWCDNNNDLEVSTLNNNVVLRFTDPFEFSNRMLFTIIGDNGPDITIQAIQSLFPRASIVMLSEEFIKGISDTSITIQEDRDNWDYIYNSADFIELSGHKYQGLRRELTLFSKSLSGKHCNVRQLDLKDSSTKSMLVNSLYLWAEETSHNDPNRNEDRVINRLLQHQGAIEHYCLGFFIDDTIEGFTIFHTVPQKKYMIFNHIKCSYKYPNQSNYEFVETMRFLANSGFEKANFEQDLGKDGLRYHKQALRPTGYIKKYAI